jgi:hypothetical protein
MVCFLDSFFQAFLVFFFIEYIFIQHALKTLFLAQVFSNVYWLCFLVLNCECKIDFLSSNDFQNKNKMAEDNKDNHQNQRAKFKIRKAKTIILAIKSYNQRQKKQFSKSKIKLEKK